MFMLKVSIINEIFDYIFGGGSITPVLKKSNPPDGGIKVSTTFTVTSTLNGTRVGCRADHNVNTPVVTSLANVKLKVSMIIMSNIITIIF